MKAQYAACTHARSDLPDVSRLIFAGQSGRTFSPSVLGTSVASNLHLLCRTESGGEAIRVVSIVVVGRTRRVNITEVRRVTRTIIENALFFFLFFLFLFLCTSAEFFSVYFLCPFAVPLSPAFEQFFFKLNFFNVWYKDRRFYRHDIF